MIDRHRLVALAGLVLAACLGGFAQDAAAQAEPPKPALPFKPLPSRLLCREAKPTIPLHGPGLTPVIQIAVGPRGPINLLFDTGCSNLILFDPVIAPLKLAPRPIDIRIGTGGTTAVTAKRAARIDALYVLDGREPMGQLRELDALVFKSGPPVRGIQTFGVFGGRLLRPVVFTFDLKKKRLVITTDALPEPDGEDVLAMDGDTLAFPTTIAGVRTSLMIDTGYHGGISIPTTMAKSLRFKSKPVSVGSLDSAGGSSPVSVARLDGSIRIGRFTLTDPIVAISDATSRPNLGVQLLRHWRVSVDQSRGRVRFARDDADRPIPALPYRRLAFTVRTKDGITTVATVDERSPAHTHGLRIGDRIIEVEGLAGPSFTNFHIAELELELTRPTVRMRIERDETESKLKLPFAIVVP